MIQEAPRRVFIRKSRRQEGPSERGGDVAMDAEGREEGREM